MKIKVVLTTIQNPTNCVEKWAKLLPDEIIAVGDRKTPSGWNSPGVKFLDITEQENTEFKLSAFLPENHYCRKMLGYLQAIKDGANIIFDTDDDNEPYPHCWSNGAPVPSSDHNAFIVSSNYQGFVNPYSFYTPEGIKAWPRGMPLQEITCPHTNLANLSANSAKNLGEYSSRIPIWQGLVDGDPDVDAIHRLVFGIEFNFLKKDPLVLPPGVFAPFNSQNTAWIDPHIFPLLYLPTTVSFRYTDILRSYVALSVMEKMDLSLGFTSSTAYQNRNEHNLMQDFKSETSMYLSTNDVMSSLCKITSKEFSIMKNLKLCYDCLEKMGITRLEESSRLDAWVSDLSTASL
jgi:hypothetical protein